MSIEYQVSHMAFMLEVLLKDKVELPNDLKQKFHNIINNPNMLLGEESNGSKSSEGNGNGDENDGAIDESDEKETEEEMKALQRTLTEYEKLSPSDKQSPISSVSDKMIKDLLNNLKAVENVSKQSHVPSEEDQRLFEKLDARTGRSRLRIGLKPVSVRSGMEAFAASSSDTPQQLLIKEFMIKQPANLKTKVKNYILARDTYCRWFRAHGCRFAHIQRAAFPDTVIHEDVLVAFVKSLCDEEDGMAYKRKTALFTLRNLNRYCVLTGKESFMDKYRNGIDLPAAIRNLKSVYSSVLKQAPVMSYIDEYLLYMLIDFDDLKMLRFWSLHLFAMESGQRNATLCVLKGKHLRFKLVKEENYPDGVAVHVQYFLESIKTMSCSSDTERGDVDKWMPLMASQKAWSCASRTLLYFLCRLQWIDTEFHQILDNPPDQIMINPRYDDVYVFGKFEDELQRSTKDHKIAEVSIARLERLVNDTSMDSIERYKELSCMMEQFDPRVLPLMMTNQVYHKFSNVIRPGKPRWTTYSARRTLNTRIKSIAFMTGEESKSEVSRIMLGHRKDSKIHDGYMDTAALTTTNMTAFSRMEDMSKVSTITDSVLDTDLSKCEQLYTSLTVPFVPMGLTRAIETFAKDNHCTAEKSEHQLGLILCGEQEYPVQSNVKLEKQCFKQSLIRFFLDESKKPYLKQSAVTLIDSDEKRSKRRLVARKLIVRQVWNEGGLSMNVHVPDFLIKRAFNVDYKFQVSKREVYAQIESFMSEHQLLNSDDCTIDDSVKHFLQQVPVISIVDQSSIKKHETKDREEEPSPLFPLKWFSLDQLKTHQQSETIFNMIRGLSDYRNWRRGNDWTTRPPSDQLDIVLPCQLLDKLDKYHELFLFVNQSNSKAQNIQADAIVQQTIDEVFQSPVSTNFSSLPKLVQHRLISIVEQHDQFHRFIQRLIEDKVSDVSDQKQYCIGRVATMIDVKQVSKLLIKGTEPSRAYAGVFMTVLKELNKKRPQSQLIHRDGRLNLESLKQLLCELTGSKKEEDDEMAFPLRVDKYDELCSKERAALQEALLAEEEFLCSLRELKKEMTVKDFKISSRNSSNVKYQVAEQYVVRRTETKQSHKPCIKRRYYAQLYLSVAKELGWVKRGGAWLVESIPPPPLLSTPTVTTRPGNPSPTVKRELCPSESPPPPPPKKMKISSNPFDC